MSRTITVTEVARNLSEIVNRVVYGHETFILVRGKKPVAELRPVAQGVLVKDLPSVLASLPKLAPGDAEQFARDIESAREELNRQGLRDPWHS